MFDFSTMNTHDSLAINANKQMFESELALEQKKNQTRQSLLESIANQYNAINNTPTAKKLQRQKLTESATIAAVRDVIFNIFESALLIDDNEKSLYQPVLKEVFSKEFKKLLVENSISSLTEFKKKFEKSSTMMSAILETSTNIVSDNSNLFNELLESYYDDSEMHASMLETFTILFEADTELAEKEKAIFKTGKSLKEKIIGANVESVIKYGVDVKRLVIGAILLLTAPVIPILPPVIGLVVGVVGAFFGWGHIIASDIHLNKNKAQYLQQAKDIKEQLTKLLSKIDTNSKEYTRIKGEITRADQIINVLGSRIKEDELRAKDKKIKQDAKEAKKKNRMLEAVTDMAMELIVECGYGTPYDDMIDGLDIFIDNLDNIAPSLTTYDQKNIFKNIVTESTLSEFEFSSLLSSTFKIMNEAATDTDKKEEALVKTGKSLREKLFGADMNSIIKHGYDIKLMISFAIGFISIVAYPMTIVGAIVSTVATFLAISHVFASSVYQQSHREEYLKQAKDIKDELTKLAAKLDKTSKEYFKVQKQINRADKIIIRITTSINHDRLAGGLAMFKECVGLVSDDFNHNGMVDTKKLMHVACVLYEATNTMPPDMLSEACHKKLSEGQMPDEEQFLDQDERDLLDTVASINGKDLAIDKIKNKVIDVIDTEEKRAKQRADEEKKLLNKMSPAELDGVKDKLNESSSISIGSTRLNMPETLFEAIIMNRSKKYIQESAASGEVDLIAHKETILSESMVIYTILETFNTLNLNDFTQGTMSYRQLMNDYYYNKI